MKCPTCKVDVTNAQVALNFRALPGGGDWSEFPVIAGVCAKCGWMSFHMAEPKAFAEWTRSQKR
jgi:hypothetical protein